MVRSLRTFMPLALLAVHSPATAQTRAAPEIVVSGTGRVTVMPDRATVVVEVRTEAATPQEASAKNAPIMTAVLDALRRIGYRAERLSTRGYTVQPNFRWEGGGPTLIGYVAFNAVTVRLDDVRRVGETLDAVLSAGATRVGSVRFESSEFERVRRQALERAVATARMDAEALARAAGGTLGDLISVSTEAREVSDDLVVAVAPPPSSGGETPINAGEQMVVASVVARWQFVKR